MAGVLGGTFLAAIEMTVVAAAMPTVADQLGGLAWYSWVFSAYLLASTVSIPLWGKLSDLYGRRRFYLWCIGIFLLGSALSGAAPSMAALIAFRTLQGLGAGGLMPLGMSIIGDHYTLEERGRTQGLLSAVWGVASVVGPLAGGYITALLSWRWVFYLNIPFGILAAVAVGAALRDPAPGVRRNVDYAGAALLMTSVTLLLLAVGQTGVAGRGAWAAPTRARPDLRYDTRACRGGRGGSCRYPLHAAVSHQRSRSSGEGRRRTTRAIEPAPPGRTGGRGILWSRWRCWASMSEPAGRGR